MIHRSDNGNDPARSSGHGLCDAANNVNPDVITLCHGSPVYMPDDAQGINGFYGASSMERLHTEIAIREQMEKFKANQEFQCS